MALLTFVEAEKAREQCAKCGNTLQRVFVHSKGAYGNTIPCAVCWNPAERGRMMVVPFMRELPLWTPVAPETSTFAEVRFRLLDDHKDVLLPVWSQQTDL